MRPPASDPNLRPAMTARRPTRGLGYIEGRAAQLHLGARTGD